MLGQKCDFHHANPSQGKSIRSPWTQPWNGFIHSNFWNSVHADNTQMAQSKCYYFNLFIHLSSQPFSYFILFFPSSMQLINLTHAEKATKMHWPVWISSNIMMRNTLIYLYGKDLKVVAFICYQSLST